MLALWQLLLSNIVVASVLALLAVGLGSLLRRPALTHGLWLLVLLKLITPPLVPVTIVLPAAVEAGEKAEPALPLVEGEIPAPAAVPQPERMLVPEEAPPRDWKPEERPVPVPEEEPAAEPEEDLAPAEEVVPPPAPAVSPDDPLTPWVPALVSLWLTAALVWFVVAGLRVRRFQRLLRHGRAADGVLQGQVGELARKLGLRQPPPVWLVEGCVSPMLWMVGGRARLLLPVGLMERLNDEQRATLLLHELAHLRRGDPWVRWLEMAVTGLYWWLPLLWWARGELRQAEEECCDAWVVWALPGSSRAYAQALVEAVDFLSGAPTALPALASGVGPVQLLRRRLTMILRGTTSPKLTGIGFVALLATGVLVPLLPSWAQPPDDPQPKPRAGERQRFAQDGQKARAEKEMQRAEKEVQQMERALQSLKRVQDELHAKMAKYDQQMRQAAERLKAARAQQERAEKPRPNTGGTAGAPPSRKDSSAQGDTERRLRDMERKLDNVLRELQRERGSTPRAGQPIQVTPPRPAIKPVQPPALPKGASMGGAGSSRGSSQGQGDTDRRLRDMERKLDAVLREVKQLRSELKGGKGGKGGSGAPGTRGTGGFGGFGSGIGAPPGGGFPSPAPMGPGAGNPFGLGTPPGARFSNTPLPPTSNTPPQPPSGPGLFAPPSPRTPPTPPAPPEERDDGVPARRGNVTNP